LGSVSNTLEDNGEDDLVEQAAAVQEDKADREDDSGTDGLEEKEERDKTTKGNSGKYIRVGTA
jgi:hypothetical protein